MGESLPEEGSPSARIHIARNGFVMSPTLANELHLFRSMFDANPIVTTLSRLADGKFVEVNEAFLRVHGYSREEVIGHTSTELNVWAFPEARRRLIAILEKDGSVDDFPVQWYHRSGVPGSALMNARVIDVDGELYMAAFITESRLLDEKQKNLPAADHFYATLFEEIPSGIAVCRMHYDQGIATDWTYLRVNPAFERLTGMQNVIGRWISELIPGMRQAHPEVFEIYGRVARGQGSETFEVYVEPLKLQLEIMAFSHQPEHFVAVFQDISHRKRLEQELRISRERLELVLKAAKLGTWDTNWKTGQVVLDQRWCEILGYAPEMLPSNKEILGQLIHPEDKARVLAAMKEHELGNTPLYQCEYRLRHKDGHWVWVASRGQIVARDEEGKSSRIMGTVKDISDERRLAQSGADVLRQIESMVQHLMGARDKPLGADTSRTLLGPEVLSRRQRQILILIARGKTSAEIGKELKVATATVISHRRRLMNLLQVHSAAELTRYAIKHELVGE